jgi:MSHA biogenesis protein MshN
MSLINDVLRNLEAKRPDDLARQNLQREIRSLPSAAKSRSWLRWSLLTCLLAAIGVVGWSVGRSALLPSAASVDSVVVPAPIPQPAPAIIADPVLADKLRLAFELSVPPLPPQQAAVESLPSSTVAPVQAGTPARNEPAAVVSGPVSIEKSPVLATPRDRAEAEYRKAEAALASGHTAEASESMQAALRQDPAFIAPRQALLGLLLAQRRLPEAARLLEEGLALQPGQTQWVMSLARVQLEQGELAKADETLARYQNQAMHLADYAGFQGHLKSRLGAHADAVTHYSRAVRMAPAEGRWWLGLGLALQADGKAADAREAFRRALATANLSPELAAVAQQQLQN